MDLQLTPDQKAFIRDAIERGRFRRAEDAIEEAMAFWEERERARAEIQAALDIAETSLERGKGRVITAASLRMAIRRANGVEALPRKRLLLQAN